MFSTLHAKSIITANNSRHCWMSEKEMMPLASESSVHSLSQEMAKVVSLTLGCRPALQCWVLLLNTEECALQRKLCTFFHISQEVVKRRESEFWVASLFYNGRYLLLNAERYPFHRKLCTFLIQVVAKTRESHFGLHLCMTMADTLECWKMSFLLKALQSLSQVVAKRRKSYFELHLCFSLLDILSLSHEVARRRESYAELQFCIVCRVMTGICFNWPSHPSA